MLSSAFILWYRRLTGRMVNVEFQPPSRPAADSASDAFEAVGYAGLYTSLAAILLDLLIGILADDGVAGSIWVLGCIATGGVLPVAAGAIALWVWPGSKASAEDVGGIVALIAAPAIYVAPFVLLLISDLSSSTIGRA